MHSNDSPLARKHSRSLRWLAARAGWPGAAVCLSAAIVCATVAAAGADARAQIASRGRPIFDGRTFTGWEGDTRGTWRIEDGAIVGGSLTETVPHNDFIVTTRSYGNFILRLKFKLVGKDGFVNSGVQFRSRRLEKPAYEMTGYQADLGDKYWGSLYDESRRNKTLAEPTAAVLDGLVKRDDWNDYEIRAEGRRIRLFLNGKQTVDYTEADASIPQEGLIGLQIHGGGKAVVHFKDIYLEELPTVGGL